jgi:hypothetical protein
VLTAYWTIKTTIEAQTPGVGYDVDVCVLSNENGPYVAKKLARNEFLEHDEFIQAAKEALGAVRDRMHGGLAREESGASHQQAVVDEPPTLKAC